MPRPIRNEPHGIWSAKLSWAAWFHPNAIRWNIMPISVSFPAARFFTGLGVVYVSKVSQNPSIEVMAAQGFRCWRFCSQEYQKLRYQYNEAVHSPKFLEVYWQETATWMLSYVHASYFQKLEKYEYWDTKLFCFHYILSAVLWERIAKSKNGGGRVGGPVP